MVSIKVTIGLGGGGAVIPVDGISPANAVAESANVKARPNTIRFICFLLLN